MMFFSEDFNGHLADNLQGTNMENGPFFIFFNFKSFILIFFVVLAMPEEGE